MEEEQVGVITIIQKEVLVATRAEAEVAERRASSQKIHENG